MALSLVLMISFASCSQKGNQETASTQTQQEVADDPESTSLEEENDSTIDVSTELNGESAVGQYEVGEKGNEWIIHVNKDNTIRIWKKSNPKDIIYGSNGNPFFESDGEIYIDADDFNFKFKNESGNILDSEDCFGWHGVIIGKWFYIDSDAAKAKNPTKRIAVRKIK